MLALTLAIELTARHHHHNISPGATRRPHAKLLNDPTARTLTRQIHLHSWQTRRRLRLRLPCLVYSD